jgi:hypothetical protein
MLAEAVSQGLDFLGVTDHNQVAHHLEYAQLNRDGLPIVLPGVEVTTYGGHWNAWGTDRWWEFRDPGTAAVTEAMRAAADTGALVSVNHPKPFGPPWQYAEADGYHAIEIWNGAWDTLNYQSLQWWDQHLRAGRRIIGLGGSDTHNLRAGDHLGRPTTWAHVGAQLTAAGVLGALRAGRVFISAAPAGPQLYLRRIGSSLHVHVVGASGAVLTLVSDAGLQRAAVVDAEDWESEVVSLAGRRYVRAQLMDAAGQMLALTNPVYAA